MDQEVVMVQESIASTLTAHASRSMSSTISAGHDG